MEIIGLMWAWLFSEPLKAGSQAPEFEAKDDTGNSVRLSALRGKNVVLVFYPGDDTAVCTVQLSEFRDLWSEAEAKNTLVFGVNPAGYESHADFRRKNHLPFPLLIDEKRRMASAYNANGLIIKRTVYVIGPDGVIRFGQRGKPPAAEVLANAR